MFGLSQKSLSTVSRNLGTLLSSGVAITKAFRLAGRKASDPKLRAAFSDAAESVRAGDSVSEALEKTRTLPTLFIDLVTTAEQTGSLPEVLHALADHYEKMVELRRDFRSQIAMPVMQFLAAIFIVAFLIFVLGMVAETTGGKPMDPVGLGFTGGAGAIAWLGLWAIIFTSLFIGYKILSKSVSATRVFDRMLLNIPIVGHCLTKFALARFSWAFHLTQNSGLSIDESINSSLRATSNAAFSSAGPAILKDIYNGLPLSDALENTGLFPADFIEMVNVGETSGTVPEALHHLSPQLEADARRALKAMASAAGWAVWACVAGFIIYLIFRIAWIAYIQPMNEALKMI